ncbi:MAG: methyltransferase domain-containing protein [Okeania sp. SIO3B5]|uniref:class I SAM-dependent DNA methyltransferase n=1 Tax=Okeania sp. SIO3B5 TaxID=2607811 RepID=UPI0014001D72|nr:class I SAM-dependent methyltransferase [Okeania sp. SIO3B5]NEO53495.1 methyltransferase domain-containing protein [Okeania sp. SIO3B5]
MILLSQLALPQYPELSAAYDKMCEAIQTDKLGWAYYLCEKVSDRLSWIYETNNQQSLRDKYDAWSRIYDAELDQPYRISPILSARALAGVLPDKEASILDAGAGTGMVGEALAELGYSNIVGVDLSEEMLEVARNKQVDRALHQGNLYHVRLNTYTLEVRRQEAGGRRQKGRKGAHEKKFFITLLSGHDIRRTTQICSYRKL